MQRQCKRLAKRAAAKLPPGREALVYRRICSESRKRVEMAAMSGASISDLRAIVTIT